ncbi:hypothetical protein llap_10679 [Limosa lapponica baueri]|uniref:Uncharacterized protein n=1 Tax=Limosa lapponica baueri TaxID=1758121 RepID=A0A2I0TZ01_LIMLA|nr:hypothetical protein llap_10679 [Limosa lapponica baueri]
MYNKNMEIGKSSVLLLSIGTTDTTYQHKLAEGTGAHDFYAKWVQFHPKIAPSKAGCGPSKGESQVKAEAQEEEVLVAQMKEECPGANCILGHTVGGEEDDYKASGS